jgi:hydrogenase-4 component B
VSAIVAALFLLAAGALLAVALARWPRAALFASLCGMGGAGLVGAGGALRVLGTDASSGGLLVGWPLPMGGVALGIDGLSAWFLLTIGIVSTAVAIYAWGYFQNEIGRRPLWALGFLLNLLVAAMVITVCATDIILFLVGWELMSLSAFLLVGFHHRDAQARRGAWMYLAPLLGEC